jgi:hypothetical protein
MTFFWIMVGMSAGVALVLLALAVLFKEASDDVDWKR